MGGGVLACAAGVSMLAVPAVLLPALMRIRGAVAFALAALVVAAAEVVALSSVLSIGDHYSLGPMLASEAVVAVAAAAVWARAGRPAVPRPARLSAGSFRAHRTIAVLAGAAGLALVIQAFQALAVVSNGWDPNAYHLSRAAYWLQYHAVARFPGGSARENGYPPDGEIFQAWTMMLAGGDALVNLVQWVALPALGAATYLTARAARFARPAATLAALLVVTLPLPMLEATTANSDLICAFFVLTAAVLGVRAIRDRHGGEAAVAAMAVALAVGTKGIAIVVLPSLLIVWAAAAFGSRVPLRRLALYASFVVVAFAALGASFFVQNLQATGTPYGHANDGTARTSGLLENTLWVDWRYIDLPGTSVAWVDMAAANVGETLLPESGPITYLVQHRVDDSAGGFGPLVPLFLFPLLLWYLIRTGADPTRRSLAAASGLFLLMFPVLFEMNGDLPRLALSGIVLGAPLLAALASRPAAAGAAVLLALTVLGGCVLQNPHKRLLVRPGDVPAFRMSRAEQFALARPGFDKVLQTFERHVAPTAPIAFVGVADDWDYPFFGRHLERRVYRLDSARDLPRRMRRLGVRAAVLPAGRPPGRLRSVPLGIGWTLVIAPRRQRPA